MHNKRTRSISLSFILLLILTHTPMNAQIYLDPNATVEQRVNDLLSKMTVDEKIGQMMQPDISALTGKLNDIPLYGFGSILSGGDSDPGTGSSALNYRSLHDTLQKYSLQSRLKIPMIYGIDAVHGHSNVVGATIFPHNIGLGCTRDSALIEKAAHVTAVEMSATGIRWNFAPMIGVPQDERWGRFYEGFGETPELAQLGAVQVKGLQLDSLSDSTSVLACAKHFLGDGGTQNGIDQGNVIADEATVRKIHLPSYLTALKYQTGSIMVSFSSINGLKMHGSKHWLTDVLKTELGFKGFLVSDWGGVDQLGADYTNAVEMSINAGMDMVMLPLRYNDFLNAMRSLITGGKIPISRVDDAVRRILTVKFRMGLFERPYSDPALIAKVGSQEHRDIARQCVRESMVLLKRKDGVLPLPKKNARIIVAGSHADDIGYQCGGWTISWQGKKGNITTGTTILSGMKKIAPEAQIDYSETGTFVNTKADYAVAVIGETPYAEGKGDKNDLSIPSSDVALIKKLKSYGCPVVVILVTGRPMILEKILHYSDAVIAAWLPGTEGEGIAEVIFGDHAPKGLLSHSWPKRMDQIPITVGDANYDPLYPFGFGITSWNDPAQGTPPTLLSGIITEDGKHIELTFNKSMKDPSLQSPNLTIRKNNSSVHAVSLALKTGDTTTLLLTLDSTFTNNDAGTIAYLSGNLQAKDGGQLQPFDTFRLTNWFRPAAVAIPAKIEAENFSDMSGIETEATTDSSGGKNLTSIDNGDWMEYSVTVPTLAYYTMSLRISSLSVAGNISVLLNGVNKVSRSLPVTGSWNTWSTVKQTVPLPAGDAKLTVLCNTGGFKLNWISFETVTGVSQQEIVLPEFRLEQNYPNPFNPSTTIEYSIPEHLPGFRNLEGVAVTITLYDVSGKEIEILVKEVKKAGTYSVRWDASRFSSGIYFVGMKAGDFSLSKKMVLTK